jgi:EAL domain-containing protein (putative c-di-GMP-specific phosphodiesterase class I)
MGCCTRTGLWTARRRRYGRRVLAGARRVVTNGRFSPLTGRACRVREFYYREEAVLTRRLTQTLGAIGDEFGEFLSHRRGPLRPPLLSAREVEVLQSAADGYSGPEIAGRPPVHVSIGIALFDGTQKLTADDVLVAADIAMYQVKEAGGDQAAVYDGRSGALMSRVKSIREALAEQRFVLHAQPIVDLRNGRVAYHELLIRMISETGEIIPPGDFLPIAERFSLAGEIDSWVVGEALELARHQPVTVNLSGRSIGDPGILSAITNAVGAGLDPRSLMIEITETAALSELENATAFALALVELGCDLALDDFGTGFGSFTYLKLVPARYLKIDVEFVRDINTDPTDKEIVRSIVGIARTLGKETIAEGVESPGVLQTLRELGVGYAQGFQLGRPEPLVPPPTAVTPGANGAQISRTRSGATSSGPRTSPKC